MPVCYIRQNARVFKILLAHRTYVPGPGVRARLITPAVARAEYCASLRVPLPADMSTGKCIRAPANNTKNGDVAYILY